MAVESIGCEVGWRVSEELARLGFVRDKQVDSDRERFTNGAIRVVFDKGDEAVEVYVFAAAKRPGYTAVEFGLLDYELRFSSNAPADVFWATLKAAAKAARRQLDPFGSCRAVRS